MFEYLNIRIFTICLPLYASWTPFTGYNLPPYNAMKGSVLLYLTMFSYPNWIGSKCTLGFFISVHNELQPHLHVVT